MSFRLARLVHYAASIMVGLFFFVLGITGIILAWSPSFQSGAVQFILDQTFLLTLLGSGFAIAGFLLFLYPFLIERRQYIQIRSGPYAVTLDENVIHRSLTAYWEKLFPGNAISYDLQCNKKSIQIVADLPPIPIEQQKLFIEQLQADLNELFRVQFGAPHEVHLLISFENNINK